MISEIKGVNIIGEAGNVPAAVGAIEKLRPDVVILDIRMPGGDVMEVLASLKKGKNPPLVIIFTNYPYLQYRKKCLDVGADFFFYKATEFERLADLLKQLTQTA
jgi:DNA-binding NarL/FixJ family response regulator